MLKINHISKRFGSKEVLKDCCLEIKEGSIVGIIGINGAGKSTLLRCMSGIYKCDSGCVTWDEEDIYENEKRKKEIMFLCDDPHYENSTTIAKLKEFFTIFYDGFDQTKYEEYLQETKLDEHKTFTTFSKGMRRQAFILLMLSFKPKVLIMDESFDGLDPLMKSIMKKAVSNMVAENNSIVIISSHSLSDIESICDQYVIMDQNTLSKSEDMEDNKLKYHRVQIAFNEVKAKEDFQDLDIIYLDNTTRIVTLVISGEIKEIEEKLKAMNPIMIEVSDLSLEELFISKMKGEMHYE